MTPKRLTEFKSKLIICNPVAGGGNSKRAYDRFMSHHHLRSDSFKTYFTKGPNDRPNIKAAVDSFQPDLLIIIGGDGTIHQVLNSIGSVDIPVMLLPAGSGNDLHFLCSDRDLSQTIEAKDYTRVESDIWDCNGHLFHNGVGIGFDGSIAGWTQGAELTWLNPQWKYWIAILRNLLFYKSKRCEVKSEQVQYEGSSFMISIANGTRYGGGFEVAPGAQRDDELLDVVLIGHVPVWKRFFYIPKVQKGRHLSSGFVQHFRTNELDVTYKKKVFAHLDGEVIEAEHFRCEYFGKLSVYV